MIIKVPTYYIYNIDDRIIKVREFDAKKDSITELTKLLHKSYKSLADIGLNFEAATQSELHTLNRINDGRCFVALFKGTIIGTICFYTEPVLYDCKWYNNKEACRFGQFAVSPDCQKTGLGKFLLKIVEEQALAHSKKYLALDTSEKAFHLIEYYNKLGFKHVDYYQWDSVNYRSVIMIKLLHHE